MATEKVIKIARIIAVVGNAISIIIGIVLTGVGILIKTGLKAMLDRTVGKAAGGYTGFTGIPEGPVGDFLDSLDAGIDAVSGALLFFGLWMMFANSLGCFVTLAQKPKEQLNCCC